MTTIFDCCDSCDAVMTDAEKAAGQRFGQSLCDHCATEYAAANPAPADVLAKLDKVIADPSTPPRHAMPLREVRDSVAALIEDVRKIKAAAVLGIRYHSIGPGYTEEIQGIADKAIARVGGAA